VSLLGAVGAWIGISFGRVYALPVVSPDLVPPPPLVPAIDQSIKTTAKQTTAMGMARLMQGSENRSCNPALTTQGGSIHRCD
jgi:hypothetical protein